MEKLPRYEAEAYFSIEFGKKSYFYPLLGLQSTYLESYVLWVEYTNYSRYFYNSKSIIWSKKKKRKSKQLQVSSCHKFYHVGFFYFFEKNIIVYEDFENYIDGIDIKTMHAH